MPHKVLIVEDETLIAMDLQSVVEAAGYEVLGPTSSIEMSLLLLEAAIPDVAILDVKLHGIVTQQIAERLKELRVPLIVCSGYGTEDLGDDTGYAGAIFLAKPVDRLKLLVALETLARD